MPAGIRSLKPTPFNEPTPQPGLGAMQMMSRPETGGAMRNDHSMEQGFHDPYGRPGTAGGDMGGGGRPKFGSGPGGKDANKFIYRGGFKMPKPQGGGQLVVSNSQSALPYLPGNSVGF